MKKSHKINILLLIFSIIFVILFLEINLRLINYKIPENIILFKSGNGLNVLNLTFIRLSNNKELIYELKPNCTHCPYYINTLGMEDKEYPIEKPNNTNRIIMIGDSILAGVHVTENERFSELVEEKVNTFFDKNIEIMNSGVVGYNLDQEYEVFKKSLKLNPDIIILDISQNDDARKIIVKKTTNELIINEYYESYPLVLNNGLNIFMCKYSYFIRLINHRLVNLLNIPPKYYYNLDNMKIKLNLMKQLAKNNEIQFLVVYHPDLINSDKINERSKTRYNLYKTILDELEIEYLDLLPYYDQLDAESLRLKPEDVAHLNEKGHEITAEIIYGYLYPKLKNLTNYDK